METITTKFYGPTDSRGARIRASSSAGSLTIPYDYELGNRTHGKAAISLARKQGWKGTLVEGETRTGKVFVFLAGDKHEVE